MQRQNTEFTLKDGRRAVLRCPRKEDIPGVLEYLRLTAGETEFLLREPEECDKYTYEGEKAFFERCNASPNELMLVCVVDGVVAGNCQLSIMPHRKNCHRASIGIALRKEFWNQGIGTAMFRAMIDAAREHGGILQLELEFVEGNARARHLYEKMGFRIAAVHPNAIRFRDGSFGNEYLMIRPMD